MKKTTLLINFFREESYGAYDEMIKRLSPKLLTLPKSPRLVERLDFRPDLPRGSRKEIYDSIARLLQSGFSVLRPGYGKNDLYRWLSDPSHTNLGEKFQTIQRAVNKRINDGI